MKDFLTISVFAATALYAAVSAGHQLPGASQRSASAAIDVVPQRADSPATASAAPMPMPMPMPEPAELSSID